MSLPAALPAQGRAAPAGAGNSVMAGADARTEAGGFAGVAERIRSRLDSSAVTGEALALPADEPVSTGVEPEHTPAAEGAETDAGVARKDDAAPDIVQSDSSPNDELILRDEGALDKEESAPADTGTNTAVETEANAQAVISVSGLSEPEPDAVPAPQAQAASAEAPVQLWRLREQAQTRGTEPRHTLPDTAARQTSRLPEPNALLLQRLSGSEAAPAAQAATSPATPEAPPLFAHALSALRTAPTGSHEWAPVQLQPGDKAALGEQLLQTLKDKVELQLNQRVQQARIKLDPPEMGRMELTVRLEGERLHVQINASHSGLRDAITAQADRLRHDLLAHHGAGVEVHVGQDGRQEQPPLFNQDMQIGAAVAEPEDERASGPMGLGWINALA
ncbi:flagellar hook-length control protein FliK [Oceanimonas sp. CHS3-5]|uniref:flagellar hook-length control protein FliK n=1 Tax=Oceanimonas sp. CHS3-5 TaxID=3068186 RepID=UPI00273F1805|nr:flagellar hook-length control protein FliK [Oceanimonas sp. CHS3-5]MDP5292374.1 flagellar hook-length control protein FliK [Oceanimonas sp. CHS3-5]